MEFPNVNFTTDAIILDESFNYRFPNPTNEESFQNPNCLPYFLGSESSLDSSQMNLNSFCQPKSQVTARKLQLTRMRTKIGCLEKLGTRKGLTCQGKEKDIMLRKNVTLKAQLGGTGVPSQVPPPPGINPYTPPWMSYTPYYMMNRQGSQVPVVPIPKLKSQALSPTQKSNKKLEKKKSEVKTKKVFSVSCVLFFILLFGGLGGQGESNQKNTNRAEDEFAHVGNGSDPLAHLFMSQGMIKFLRLMGTS
uniref:Uncharacterized protein n=1 Tax=Solanum lycopersicum TaxID=4081 RepID=A0A3Q7FGP8_SOLLC